MTTQGSKPPIQDQDPETEIDAETLKTKALMQENMSSHAANIMLSNVIFKTGRITLETQNDYKKAIVLLFRDATIALAYKHLIDMLKYEQRQNSGRPVDAASTIGRLALEAQTQHNKSFNQFEHLHSHLRLEHKEEILNLAKAHSFSDIEWKD